MLKNIVSIAQKNQHMFQPHQKSFYVHGNDSIQIKLLKLEILTCLANESNISVILREFQVNDYSTRNQTLSKGMPNYPDLKHFDF